jgi:methylamine--corrinoid protein Co-methyltransferase
MFGAGSPVSEDIYLKVLESYAKEPLADTFSGGIGLNTVGGMPIRANAPSEVYAAVLNAILTRQAAVNVGKPKKGIHNVVGSATSTAAIIAANRPEFGIRKSDGFLVGSLPELKIDYERLNKVAYLLASGNIIGALYGPIMGGYAGGPEGTAVITVATAIQNTIFFQPHYHMCFPIHIRHLCNTTRELLWVISMVGQAISRNTHLLVTVAGELASGPCTDMVLYEATAYSLVGTISGLNLMAVEVANNRYLDHCTGMEARMAAEVGHAVAESNMKRNDANELIKKVLKKYEDRIKNAPIGKSFRECYDVKTATPSDEYLNLYKNVVKELRDLGIEVGTH